MSDREGLNDLEDVLDKLEQLGEQSGEVSIADIQEEIGQRSFGPFLVVLGLITLSPIGGLPGVPTIFGVIVLLTAGQLLLGQKSFWLPRFITNRSVKADRLGSGAKKLRGPAKWVDKVLRPRLTVLASGPATYIVAACCVVLAILMPLLELIPFAATAPALAVTGFGLALVANDGVLAALGYIATAVTLYLIVAFVPFSWIF